MLYEKVMLDDEAYVEAYIPDDIYGRKKDSILVIPGGGYGCVCSAREGEPIALYFLAKGYNAYILHYSVGEKAVFPRPLIQASLAVKYIKDNAEKHCGNRERVFATGFSAGGHLCASLGTLWHMQEIYDATGMEYGYNKVKAVVPVYPVISGLVEGTHMLSFYNILGTQTPTREQLELYSLERRVDERTVPMFLIHTVEDQMVSVRNSLVMAQALTDAGIPFGMRIYPHGLHGMALCNKITSAPQDLPFPSWQNERWIDDAHEWMEDLA